MLDFQLMAEMCFFIVRHYLNQFPPTSNIMSLYQEPDKVAATPKNFIHKYMI